MLSYSFNIFLRSWSGMTMCMYILIQYINVSSRHSPQCPAADPPDVWLWWSDHSCISFSCSPAFSSSCPEPLSHRQRTARKGEQDMWLLGLWMLTVAYGKVTGFIFINISVPYLVVGCVFFEMSLNTAAQLEDPAPLSLQGSCEGLQETKTTW